MNYTVFNHVYINLAGNKYYDYVGITDFWPSYLKRKVKEKSILISGDIIDSLVENLSSYLDDTVVLNDNDDIHIVPDCVYSIRDIRNNYKIKRDFDSGKYNVFSPIKPYIDRFAVHTIVVVDRLKKIALLDNKYTYPSGAKKAALDLIPEAEYEDMEFFSCSLRLCYSSHIAPYMHLVVGDAKKPCISYTKLKFNNSNELTPDVLMFVYKAGITSEYESSEAEENFLVQLGILNQHNWRDYPRTISFLFYALKNRGVAHDVFCTMSKYPKHVKEIYDVAYNHSLPFMSEKDFLMAQQFVQMLLDVKPETMFVQTKQLMDKIVNSGFRLDYFSELYNTVTRIVPKKYEG